MYRLLASTSESATQKNKKKLSAWKLNEIKLLTWVRRQYVKFNVSSSKKVKKSQIMFLEPFRFQERSTR